MNDGGYDKSTKEQKLSKGINNVLESKVKKKKKKHRVLAVKKLMYNI